MLPPSRVHIKRKATDDPVELLHVHDELGTSRSIKKFVFKRQRTSTPSSTDPIRFTAPYTGSQPSGRAPTVKVSQPGDELREQNNGALAQPQTAASEAAKKQADIHLKDPTLSKAHIDTSTQPSEGALPASKPSTEIRRFHMSRSATPTTLQSQGGPLNLRKSTKAPVAIFHERKQQPAKPLPFENLQRKPSSVFERRDGEIKIKKEISNPLEGLRPVTDFKDKNRFGAPLRNTLLPSGETMPWNASNERLDAEMQAYTLDQIARNIEQNAQSHPSAPLTPKSTNFAVSSSPSRFKPKAPALRYHERYPEDSPAPPIPAKHTDQHTTESMDIDEDDGDYVIETYIRVPVEHVTLDEDPKNVGLLVLDSQPDIDEFYNDDSDSDSEIYDEEEDENAENHPSTDYPEDDLASDDEFDRNAYSYRNRNASDEEEFGRSDNDDAFSDDEVDKIKHPWSNRPWMVGTEKKKKAKGIYDDDTDEE